ncbi:MAG: terminase small subunit [Methylococcales bacterium]|nr:terminase small subunit [Methylococcales bacterium]MDD5754295.1 terminase small subunit [Methylococcales bacterium]
MTLKTKEKTFCQIYAANGGDGIRAAVAAGYPAHSANVEAVRLLTDDEVITYIAALTEATETTEVAETAMKINRRNIFSESFREWQNSRER